MTTRPMVELYSNPLLDKNDGRWIWRKSRYSGVMRTCCGSRFPAVNMMSRATFTLMFTRVRMNATPQASASVTATEGTVMSTEFQKKWIMPDWLQASLKFFSVR